MILINRHRPALLALILLFAVTGVELHGQDQSRVPNPQLFPNATSLTLGGDLASKMVRRIDRFLLDQTERSIKRRETFWQRNVSSPEAYENSITKNRRELARILGVTDQRIPFDAPELIATTQQSALLAETPTWKAYAVRWPVLGGIQGEGILLAPRQDRGVDVIALPDADQTPEQLCGLKPGLSRDSQFAGRLAEQGCRVLVPTLISRKMEKRNGRANLTHREFVYRTSFEMGRHIIGYEIQKVLAAVDWFTKDRNTPKIGVFGYGEGGLLALHAAAIDPRIHATVVSGLFCPATIALGGTDFPERLRLPQTIRRRGSHEPHRPPRAHH